MGGLLPPQYIILIRINVWTTHKPPHPNVDIKQEPPPLIRLVILRKRNILIIIIILFYLKLNRRRILLFKIKIETKISIYPTPTLSIVGYTILRVGLVDIY